MFTVRGQETSLKERSGRGVQYLCSGDAGMSESRVRKVQVMADYVPLSVSLSRELQAKGMTFERLTYV